jgi:hypothetical protein
MTTGKHPLIGHKFFTILRDGNHMTLEHAEVFAVALKPAPGYALVKFTDQSKRRPQRSMMVPLDGLREGRNPWLIKQPKDSEPRT